MNLIMRIVWRVLGEALDAGDAEVIAACRRLIIADRNGFKRHAADADKRLVLSFA